MLSILLIGESVRFEIDRPRTVGRHPSASIQVLDMRVSREHCVVEPLGDGSVRVRDLSSKNGTYVNGRRIDDVAVLPGEEIAVGTFRFLVEDDSRDDGPAPSSVAAATPRGH